MEKARTRGEGDSLWQAQQPRARASANGQVQGEGKEQKRSSLPGQESNSQDEGNDSHKGKEASGPGNSLGQGQESKHAFVHECFSGFLQAQARAITGVNFNIALKILRNTSLIYSHCLCTHN